MKPTNVYLKLADRSIKYPIGVLEDVLVRVGDYFMPVDFVIMYINEDFQIPIILRRSFLATAGTIIDVKRGKLTFEVSDEKIEFILVRLLKNPPLRDSLCLIDLLRDCIQENPLEFPPTSKLEESLLDNTKVAKVVA